MYVYLIVLFALTAISYFFIKYLPYKPNVESNKNNGVSPTQTPYQYPYKNRVIPKQPSYRIIVVGDSIIESLELNAPILRDMLLKLYPDSEFVTYNYGYSSTNIISLPKRLIETTTNRESVNQPILSHEFEFIVIESFANNPLSDLTLSEGLNKQEEILKESVDLILSMRPKAALAFMTPIAPSSQYAQGTLDLSSGQRKEWIGERIAYIENHKKFAEKYGIPVIDVYTDSLGVNGEVRKELVGEDYIHPSKTGVDFISRKIAEYIFQNKIFPI